MSVVSVDQSVRQRIRAQAAASYRRRERWSTVYTSAICVALLVAIIPLASIINDLLSKGLPFLSWGFLTQNVAQPSLMHPQDVGGIANALSGSLIIVGLAVAISVPLAILLAFALFEFKNKLMNWVLLIVEVFVGLPSIVFGVFAYVSLVLVTKQFHAYYGSLALCFIMVPVSTVNSVAALRSVPTTLNEAGLSLGARPSRVMLRVIFPAALPRIMTGIFLALSRTVGETAPVLFVVGANLYVNWDLNKQAATLPGTIYNNLNAGSPYGQLECWGIALVLIGFVFFFNILGRIFLARAEKK
jgi:phosphate transport system permease protein